MERVKNGIAVGFIFLSMMTIAISENMRGVFIPTIKNDFKVHDTNIGLMLTIASVAYTLAIYSGGVLCEKIGQKKVLMLGFGGMIIALIGFRFASNFVIFTILMFILSVGCSLIDITVNTLVPVLFISFQAILMNLTHFFYGFGATIGQRTAGVALFHGMNWRNLYLAAALLPGVLLLVLIFIKMPKLQVEHQKTKVDNKKIFSNRVLYFYILAMGFYIAAEIGTANWYVNFVEKSYHADKSTSSFYLALFFGIFTVGRLVGGFVVEKVGKFRAVIVSLIIALILFTAGLCIGERGLVIISISGFFFSIIFPTVIVTVGTYFKENASYIIGIIITFATFISMIVNLLIGFLNDKIGTYQAFFVLPASMMIAVVFICLISHSTKNSDVDMKDEKQITA